MAIALLSSRELNPRHPREAHGPWDHRRRRREKACWQALSTGGTKDGTIAVSVRSIMFCGRLVSMLAGKWCPASRVGPEVVAAAP